MRLTMIVFDTQLILRPGYNVGRTSVANSGEQLVKLASHGPSKGMPRTESSGVLGVVIRAIDDAGAAARANALNVTLDAKLIADIKSIASVVKGAVPVAAAKETHAARPFNLLEDPTRSKHP
jgi:hypothetical protein